MTRRLVATLLAAVLAATALAAAAALPAHAAKHMEVGLQDDGAFVSEIGLKRNKALKLAVRLKVTRIRVNVPWAKVVKHPNARKRPKHRHYDFAAYDALLNAARRKGIRLQLTISGFAPAWATGNHRTGGYRPKTGPWKEFVRKVVEHFGRHADRYSIWNEPNYHTWLSPIGKAPGIYHQLYTRAYKIIRHHDPSAKILIGETAPYGQSKGRSTPPLWFLRKLVSHGRLRADGFAHHPYDFRHSIHYSYPGSDNVTMSGIGRLTRELRHLAHEKRLLTPHGKPLPVYLTEYGYMRYPSRGARSTSPRPSRWRSRTPT
jgi:hypothetical protein